MRDAGKALVLVGLLMAVGALFLPITVSTSTAGVYGYGGAISEVVNLSRLQTQSLVFHAGCTLFLAGVVLFAAGSIVLPRDTGTVAAEPAAPLPSSEPYRLTPLNPADMTDDQVARAAAQDRVVYYAFGVFGLFAAVVIIWFAVIAPH